MKPLGPSLLLALAWLVHAQDAPDAPDSPERGREVYAEQACWQCHVQGRDKGFPALSGTARTGPVLDDVDLPRSREWHLAHFYFPLAVMAGSTMPSYQREFEAHPNATAVADLLQRFDKNRDGVVTQREYGGDDWQQVLARLDSGNGVLSRADAAPKPRADLDALVDYLASLERALPPTATAPREPKPHDRPQSVARGTALFARHCAGCHGERADGNGRVAPFFGAHPPRNFLRGEYKFRSTMAPDPPTDDDLFRTIRAGAGPSMPAWPQLTDRQVWDLVEFLKSNHPAYVPHELTVVGADLEFTSDGDTDDASGAVLANGRVLKRAGKWFWLEAGTEREITDGMRAGNYTFELGKPLFDWMEDFAPRPLTIPASPIAYTQASARTGAKVYVEFGCHECHGDAGKGDGINAAQTRGSLGEVVPPTDYTRGARWLKGGADPRSLVRSFLTGLHGTPMPAYRTNFKAAKSAPPERAAWHLAHFVLQQAGVPFDR